MKLMVDAKSDLSLGESVLSPEEVALHAFEAGYEAAALCDTMTISGMPDFTKACDKHGIKPIVGVRLRIVDTLDKTAKQFAVYPKLFILTNEGFRIVTRLLSKAFDEDHFYYVPRLTFADLLDALQDAQGHVAYSTSSLYSAIRDENAVRQLKEISALLTRSLTFCEICPIESAVWDQQTIQSLKVAEQYQLPILVSRPALYQKPNGVEALEVMTMIVNNRKFSTNSFTAHVRDYRAQPVATVMKDLVAQAKRIKTWEPGLDVTQLRSALVGWRTLADAVSFKWAALDISLPVMAPDENAELTRLAKEGLKARFKSTVFGHKPAAAKVYVDRLKYELDVLTGMGFANYFLLTADIVRWSKSNGIIVGPGRGSVGGSLVAYALGITDVDPIRFGLIFERFINPERIDLPDADLDFMSTRRHEVIDYIRDTYGAERVANICNFVSLGSKGALSDLSRIMDKPEAQMISKLIPSEQGKPISLDRAFEEIPAVKAFAEKETSFWALVKDVEGLSRTLSVHAGGVVVAGEPLVNRSVVDSHKNDPVVQWDKRVVEDMGLIKMDILGLATLDLLYIACQKIKDRTGKDIDIGQIPLDDEKVLKAFGKGQTVGIFQFESGGMRRLLKDIYSAEQKITFDDLSAATALYRPGPMDSGLLDDYVAIKKGESTESYEHALMQPALEETHSVIVYQEQVMRIAQDLSGFSMADADVLRKAIGKKDAGLMKTMSERFVEGAKAGMVEVELEDGTVTKVHRLRKFPCSDGQKRTVEEAMRDGADIAL